MLVACGGATREPEPSPPSDPSPTAAPAETTVPQATTAAEPAGDTLPPPVDVCLVSEGSRSRATAYPSRAGTYDPTMPIDRSLLNWSLPNRGCVSPPLDSTPRVPCPDEPALPQVGAVPCAQ